MVKISDIDLPMIFKNKLLFSHGFHNNLSILPDEVSKSLGTTNWNDQRNRSLYFSHSERDAQKWVGRINNPHVVNGELFGDLEIHDADLAMKLGPGRAPIGVSAEIKWPPQYNDPTDFTYRGFAMVPNPEVPETMINFSQNNTDGFNTAKIHTPFSDNKVEGENNADFSDGIITSQTARGLPTGEAEVEEKENSNLMSAERGLNKEMENNANNIAPEEEVKEEVVEVVEEVKEEAPVVKAEESKEADFSALNDKFDALSAEVKTLAENFAKFSEEAKEEAPVEAAPEEVVEKAVAEEVVEEEAKEEAPVEAAPEEVVEKAVEESKEAEFSELAEKIDKLADAISKKEAAPMSTAEFGATGNDKGNAVIDRLTSSLSN